MVRATRLARSRGPYVIIDGGEATYDGDDFYRALALMKEASDKAKLYRLKKSEEGEDIFILLAFRKRVPVPKSESAEETPKGDRAASAFSAPLSF